MKVAAVMWLLCRSREGKNWNIWAGTVLLQRALGSLCPHRVFLNCNVSTDIGLSLVYYRASATSVFFHAAVVLTCLVTAHFWKVQTKLTNALPWWHKWACSRRSLAWHCHLEVTHIFHGLCWCSYAGRNLYCSADSRDQGMKILGCP